MFIFIILLFLAFVFPDGESVSVDIYKRVQAIKLENAQIMEISAYNVGDINQTDDSPCIGATNIDLCEVLATGKNVCASNQIPMYSLIYVEGFGECLVLDRMNSRYTNNVDIAFSKEQKSEALAFGRKNREVYIIK